MAFEFSVSPREIFAESGESLENFGSKLKTEPAQWWAAVILVYICSRENRWRPVTIAECVAASDKFRSLKELPELVDPLIIPGFKELHTQGLIEFVKEPIEIVTPTQRLVDLLI